MGRDGIETGAGAYSTENSKGSIEISDRDFLTGLYTREAAADRISLIMNAGGDDLCGALLLIDIDNFSEINRIKGPLFGDSILLEAAGGIRDVFGPSCVVGRAGGDEFVVFLEGVSSGEDIMIYASRVRKRILSISIGNGTFNALECSVGAAMYPKDAVSFAPLFAKAAAALFSSKSRGKGRCVIYGPGCESPEWNTPGQNPVVSKMWIDIQENQYFWHDQVFYYVFKMLYEADDTRKAINTILKIIGLRFGVSRAYIFEDSPNGRSTDNTFEWCNEGVGSLIDRLQNISYEDLPGYKDKFDKNGIFSCQDLTCLPKEQRNLLWPPDAVSTIQCKFCDSGRFVGFIGFDQCKSRCSWDMGQEQALSLLSQVISTFLFKERAQTILRQKLFDLESASEEIAGQEFSGEDREEMYDTLTNLLTAGAFQKEMEAYLKTNPPGGTTAAFILDMDDFKKINETRGRLFGNVLLMNVANCLKRACRPGDLIARFGGDEFLILLKHTSMEETAETAASMLEDINGLLADTDQEDAKVSCSIGIRIIEEDEREFSDIIVKADLAMCSVKACGKNGVQFYALLQDKGGELFAYDRIRRITDEKKREQSSNIGKTTTAVALEVFEKAGAFEEAMHILMGYMGNRFCLNRIVFYMNQEQEDGEQTVYQWVDDRTAVLFDPTHSFRREEFYICYNLYDGDGIAVLQRQDYEEYNMGLRKVLDRAGAHTMLFAGVFIEGRYSGMMVLVNTEKDRQWNDTERTAVSEMARIIASGVKTSLRLMEARMEAEYYKNRDNLTGLLRYEKFKEECQNVLSTGEENYVLVSSDIKGFKFINEAVGYTQGDNILRMFADMMHQNGVEGNLYTRVSADQFMAFGAYYMDRNEFIRIVQRLNDEFCRMQNEIYAKLNMMIRSGIYFIEKDCREIETAVDRATIARKSVDYIIRSTAVVYNDGPFDSSFRENEIINRMEYALKHEEFKVYLQPKFSLKECCLAGAEALVRWKREDGSIIGPGEFIPLFEKNGFISQIDYYVFRQVCRKLKEWIDQGGKPITISVNLSSVDIAVEQLVKDILECTDYYQLDHRYLEFELTETAFLTEAGITCNVMKLLQDNGFTTAIDDFGSGYSIMNMMADIPTDVIKLDCGFVQSCERTGRGREFLGQLVQMTNKMGYTSLCEGIETKEQLEMLTQMGCEIGQGFYFSRPIPMDEFFEKFCQKSD